MNTMLQSQALFLAEMPGIAEAPAWFLAPIGAICALIAALLFYKSVMGHTEGDAEMVRIAKAVRDGAGAYLGRQNRIVTGVFVALLVLLGLMAAGGLQDFWTVGGVAVAGLLSGLCGFFGMKTATNASARTTAAAKESLNQGLTVAFRAGAVMGLCVTGFALLDISLWFFIFYVVLGDSFAGGLVDITTVTLSFAMGASLQALFARVGGGIYTKAADVGADLVGKVEAGIPEDDARNPATIADNVGDNVGDVAGMGADLFESYAGSIIAPVSLIAFAAGIGATDIGDNVGYLVFPMAIAFVGMLASIVGSFFVRAGDSTDSHALSKALHMGTNIAMGLTIVATFIVAYLVFDGDDQKPWGIAVAVVGGLLVGWALGKTAEYYTSDAFNPVKKIAKQSETGPATTVLSGVSTGMVSVAASVGLIVIGVLVAWWGGDQAFGEATIPGGIYGIAVAAIGMLATTGVVVSVDAYGPISDNAGGIAEMAHLDPSVRKVTDALDSLGNTTAAIAKGFAVGSAALTALALFKSFEYAVKAAGGSLDLNVGEVDAFIGLFIGAGLPFLFAALTIDAVGRAANKMIEEVRRQFREIPGLREGAEGVIPDSARCVAISTEASLREMLVPGGLAVIVPLVVGFISVNALGGLLAGVLVSGFAIAIFMANAGGAWDNAKKYIEAGNHGGKGSDPHKAAVVGDTVGDPFKDTSGPAMNILIKVMTIVALVFASAFV